MTLKKLSVKAMYMTLPECMTLPEIRPTTIFSVKLMQDCIAEILNLTDISKKNLCFHISF